ncbi:hypothetical protein, partial [Salmonella sp. s54412]|uniref:hypothetical protein n=1 Tax=Salmonella sp. s54412 TaxID=3160128 RepID=UPI003753FE7C
MSVNNIFVTVFAGEDLVLFLGVDVSSFVMAGVPLGTAVLLPIPIVLSCTLVGELCGVSGVESMTKFEA